MTAPCLCKGHAALCSHWGASGCCPVPFKHYGPWIFDAINSPNSCEQQNEIANGDVPCHYGITIFVPLAYELFYILISAIGMLDGTGSPSWGMTVKIPHIILEALEFCILITVISIWGLLHQTMWRKLCDKQAQCLCWNLYVSASHFLKDMYRGFQLFLDVFQMLPVAENFIQHDPVLQYSAEFSGLDATSSYNSLAEFYDWFQAKITFFQVTVSHCREMCKQVNKKSIYLYQRNTP